MRRIIFLMMVLFLLGLFGCATYRPIVDMRGIDQRQYEADLRECQAYARQVSPGAEAIAGAMIGAGVGAVMGAALGSFVGQAGRGAGMGATLLGGEGLVVGAGRGAQGQIDVIRNCMMGRGYNVLR